MSNKPEKSAECVIREDGRYAPEAYRFLYEGLERAARKEFGAESSAEPGRRHVSGQQLCEALRDLAIDRYGMLASTVLQNWGLRATIDFGNMVYLLIEHGFMKKTEEDSLEDFRGVFDFGQAFELKDEFNPKK